MTQYQLHSVSKPSDAELAQAIATMSGDADISPEELMQASLVIVGEACSLMGEDKKSQEETIASLTMSGLSPESSTPLVEKAAEIVNSSINNPGLTNDTQIEKKWSIVFFTISVVSVIWYFWLS